MFTIAKRASAMATGLQDRALGALHHHYHTKPEQRRVDIIITICGAGGLRGDGACGHEMRTSSSPIGSEAKQHPRHPGTLTGQRVMGSAALGSRRKNPKGQRGKRLVSNPDCAW
jgi:hypothetical protein